MERLICPLISGDRPNRRRLQHADRKRRFLPAQIERAGLGVGHLFRNRLKTSSLSSTSPADALDARREAVFTVSPKAVKSTTPSLPTFPT